MKILSVYYTHKPGGFCKRLYRLLDALNQDNHEVHYLTLDNPPKNYPQNVYWKKIPFFMKSREGLCFWMLFILWSPLYLLFYSYKFKPERYLVFGAFYSTILSVASFFNPAPTVLFLRSLVYKIDRLHKKSSLVRTIANKFELNGIKRASKVVCMTETMARDITLFIGDDNFQYELLPNDLPTIDLQDATPFKNISDVPLNGNFTILSSGVLDKRKNIRYLLEVFFQLENEFPELKWILLIAGDGPLLLEHKQWVIENNVRNVYFLGWVNDMYPLYSHVDLIVHPSLHEGMANSVLEPLSIGVPVLCSDIPEHRELLGDDSLLFNISEKSSLLNMLRTIVNNPESELIRIKNEIIKPIQRLRFNWDECAVQLVVNE